MEVILWIVIIILIIGALNHFGIMEELVKMLYFILACAGVGMIGSWFFDYRWFEGILFGAIAGFFCFGIDCVIRIINPEYTTIFRPDGSEEHFSSRAKGIAGLVVVFVIICTLISIA